LEEKTKINAEYFVVGILAVFAIMLFTGYGAEFVVHICGFCYPFYATIKAIEAGTTKNKDDVDWLIYWGEKYCDPNVNTFLIHNSGNDRFLI
jgi:hypothetical protein